MTMRTWLLWVAAAWAMAAAPAHALSCASQRSDESEAQRMFGPAQLVFVGVLEKGENRKRESWHEHMLATFLPEQVYKGDAAPGRRVKVRVNATFETGKRYVVYANAEQGELRADAECSARTIPVPERSAAHLAMLNALPKPGSGGQLVIHLLASPDQRRIPDATLELEGAGRKISVKTDAEGKARLSGLPEGVYRLATRPPPGHQYTCDSSDSAESCNQLRVYDRGLSTASVAQVPSAQLRIKLTDARGRPVDVRAEFDVYEAKSGRQIGPFIDEPFMPQNSSPTAAMGRIVPGHYVLALVISHFKRDKLGDKAVRRTLVFDAGAADAAHAKPVEIKPGLNEYVFTLPKGMEPIRTEVDVSGHLDAGDPSLNLSLLTARAVGDRAQPLLRTDLAERRAFWSLPGQSWSVGVWGYRVVGAEHGSLTVAPVKDGKIKLGLAKYQ